MHFQSKPHFISCPLLTTGAKIIGSQRQGNFYSFGQGSDKITSSADEMFLVGKKYKWQQFQATVSVQKRKFKLYLTGSRSSPSNIHKKCTKVVALETIVTKVVVSLNNVFLFLLKP